MTTKKKRTNPSLNVSRMVQSRVPAGVPGPAWENLKWWAGGFCLLLALSFTWDNFNGGGISCWPTKKIVLRQIGHFSGVDQKCGGFLVGGLCCAKGGNIIVSDIAKKRSLLFDLKGQYLGEADPKDCVAAACDHVDDPQSHFHYIADRDYRRMKVMDPSGKLLKMVPLRDRPIGIGMDRQRRIYIGFDNYNSVQVFSPDTGKFLGDMAIENPDADYTYMDTTHFCLTAEGLLVAADHYSVRVFQTPAL